VFADIAFVFLVYTAFWRDVDIKTGTGCVGCRLLCAIWTGTETRQRGETRKGKPDIRGERGISRSKR